MHQSRSRGFLGVRSVIGSMLLVLALLGGAGRAFAAGLAISSEGLNLSLPAGSVGDVAWPAATVAALPDRAQTLVINLKTRTPHLLPRAVGDGEIALATLDASDSRITRIDTLQPVLPATRIPRTLSKLARGEPLMVAALGSSLVEGGWAADGWLRLLFGIGTEETRFRVVEPTAKIILDRHALGGSNARYTFALLGEAMTGNDEAPLPSPVHGHDLVIVALLPNEGADRLAVFEGVVRKLRAQDTEVLLLTDHAAAKKGEADGLWRDGLFVRALADRYGCALADTAAYVREGELRGFEPYKDPIHSSPVGYRLWAEAICGVLAPGTSIEPASGLDATVRAAGSPDTLSDPVLVPADARVDFLPEHSGELVAQAPDNRLLKSFGAKRGGLIKLGEDATVSLDRRPFMSVDLVIDASSTFRAEVRDADGKLLKTLANAPRRASTRSQLLCALSASEMRGSAAPPATVLITRGELRLYAVVYQLRENTGDATPSPRLP